jgi:hypothetical protein
VVYLLVLREGLEGRVSLRGAIVAAFRGVLRRITVWERLTGTGCTTTWESPALARDAAGSFVAMGLVARVG